MYRARRMLSFLFCFLCVLALCACGKETEPTVPTTEAVTENVLQIGNPWVEYETLAQAEDAIGFDFPLDETVEDSYIAEAFRVCNGELLEVVYRDDSFVVTVRMQAGEHEDISGIYSEFDIVEPFELGSATGVVKYKDGVWLKLVIFDGYSYSFYAPNGYWGDSAISFSHFYGAV